MTNRDFINHLIDIYQKARVVSLPFNNEHVDIIRRGRSHTVSGLTEDLFAYFLKENFPQIEKIVIDQPISYCDSDSTRLKTIYPDLSLITNGEIVAMIDLKMDLGRKRDKIEEIYNSAKNLTLKLRNQDVLYRDGITKSKYTVKVSKTLKYYVVVLSKWNISPSALSQALSNLRSLVELEKSEFFFLTDGQHPNAQNSEATKEQINILPDFDRLMKELAGVVKYRNIEV